MCLGLDKEMMKVLAQIEAGQEGLAGKEGCASGEDRRESCIWPLCRELGRREILPIRKVP